MAENIIIQNLKENGYNTKRHEQNEIWSESQSYSKS